MNILRYVTLYTFYRDIRIRVLGANVLFLQNSNLVIYFSNEYVINVL